MRVLLTIVGIVPCLWGAAEGSAPDKLAVGQAAPLFTLKTLNPKQAGAKMFSLRDYVGPAPRKKTRAIVVNFAASYCVPCKKELPELKRLAPKLRAAGVELAVVVIDTEPEGRAAMKKFCVDELELPFPVLSDRYGILARRYHADQLPMTVVIEPGRGTVRWLNVGFQEDAIPRLKRALGLARAPRAHRRR